MATARTLPDTRGGVILRRILTVVLIGSIIGIADQLRTLFWILLNGDGPNPVRIVVMLVGWVILCWSGYRAYRHNIAPATWIVFVMPILIWAYLLWPD